VTEKEIKFSNKGKENGDVPLRYFWFSFSRDEDWQR
jgi:hypothetical protein